MTQDCPTGPTKPGQRAWAEVLAAGRHDLGAERGPPGRSEERPGAQRPV